jgi:hypothetical protein
MNLSRHCIKGDGHYSDVSVISQFSDPIKCAGFEIHLKLNSAISLFNWYSFAEKHSKMIKLREFPNLNTMQKSLFLKKSEFQISIIQILTVVFLT